MTQAIQALVLSVLLCTCTSNHSSQVSPLPSPDGVYSVTVPVVKTEGRPFKEYWMVTISGSAGPILYQDTDGFPARFNVYWSWGENRTVWLYNSDDGKVYVYLPGGGTWIKAYWGAGKKGDGKLSMTPPAGLYPDYVK